MTRHSSTRTTWAWRALALACRALAVLLLLALWNSAPAADGTAERRIDDVSDVPAAARLALFEAQQLRETSYPDQAVDLLLGFLEEYPDQDHFLVRFHLAVSWSRRGDQENAIREYGRAVEMEPLFAQGWLNMGELAYNLGRYGLAASSLTRGYEVSEWKDPNVLFFTSAAYVMDGRPEEAVPLLRELVDDPETETKLEWHRALVMAYLDLDDDENGSRAVRAMLEQYRDDPEAWQIAFQYSASRSDYEKAVVALIITGYLRPLSVDEQMTLGDLFLAVGVPSRAGDLYEGALADSGTTADLERLASAHVAAYEFDEARVVLGRALEQESTPRLWSLLGDMNFMDKDYEGSMEAYRRSAEADTVSGRAWLMMGYCAIQLERYGVAIPPLERAAAFDDVGEKASQLLGALRAMIE